MQAGEASSADDLSGWRRPLFGRSPQRRSQEGDPSLALISFGFSIREVPRGRGQADANPQLLQFGLDPSGPPRILRRHSDDEFPDLGGDSGTPRTGPRNRAPVQAKSIPVPADHGLGLDDDEGASPVWPESAECDPESSISRSEARARLLLCVDGELLPEGQLDDGLFSTSAKECR